ncbi:MAG: bifunctional hydroxymethylpyrimidine kinase/phosphomethylpyrimidine kinase [Streptococcaceae bacterium]|jgi:pyridoxine kinase|nr:bifunctional hydroxymethylpyrimidine kinase/phosphomethylpyrimidine kinase [Streptococcaceae bacterium]
MPKKIITIAGSDSISGGGIQADLATFSEYGTFGYTAITSIVTIIEDGFHIYETDIKILKEQLDTIFAQKDIAAIKLGLLPNKEIIELVGTYLAKHQDLFIVCDPVLVFKETKDVSTVDLAQELVEHIFPYSDILTPNLAEAMVLADMKAIETLDDMHLAATKILAKGAKSVVIKGGARLNGSIAYDYYYDGKNAETFMNQKLEVNTNNGSGCTFASAITANLANGALMLDAIKDAKDFVYQGIKLGVPINDEIGNVWQGARRNN